MQVLLGHASPEISVPVFVSYLRYDATVDASGAPQYAIYLARGNWQHGHFSLESDEGEPWREEEYDEVHADPTVFMGSKPFKAVSGTEFAAAVAEVGTVWCSGGSAFMAVQNLQPWFVDEGQVALK